MFTQLIIFKLLCMCCKIDGIIITTGLLKGDPLKTKGPFKETGIGKTIPKGKCSIAAMQHVWYTKQLLT